MPAELAQAESRAKPCGAKAFAVILDRLFAFGRAFGITNIHPEDAVRSYRESLAELPEDLVDTAVHTAISSWRWGNRLPMPGDLRAFVEDDFAERKSDLTTLRLLDSTMKRPQDNTPRLPVLRAEPKKLAEVFAPPKFTPAQDIDMQTSEHMTPAERERFWAERMAG